MSFGMPDGKSKEDLLPGKLNEKTSFGVPDKMAYGLGSIQNKVTPAHPLQLSEKNYAANVDRLNMTVLRNTQGIHAPIRLAMEVKAAEKIGRLPFLESSNLGVATLKGLDDTIDFADVLNIPEFAERQIIPHVMMEAKLGILHS